MSKFHCLELDHVLHSRKHCNPLYLGHLMFQCTVLVILFFLFCFFVFLVTILFCATEVNAVSLSTQYCPFLSGAIAVHKHIKT